MSEWQIPSPPVVGATELEDIQPQVKAAKILLTAQRLAAIQARLIMIATKASSDVDDEIHRLVDVMDATLNGVSATVPTLQSGAYDTVAHGSWSPPTCSGLNDHGRAAYSFAIQTQIVSRVGCYA